MGLLFVIFLISLHLWGKYVYGKTNLFKLYGLIISRKNLLYLLKGLLIGFISNNLLFLIEFLLGWVTFQPPVISPVKLIMEGFLSAMAIAIGEELLFRGWLLTELEKDYSAKKVPFINALAFAALHFIKPITEIIRTFVTFPALFLLGLTLVWAKQTHQNLLGICIGIHGGLVWGFYILNVGKIVIYTEKVPTWITGIDQNPIAGIMGLILLSILSISIKKKYLNFPPFKS